MVFNVKTTTTTTDTYTSLTQCSKDEKVRIDPTEIQGSLDTSP